jgi:hypothetical protein
LSPLRALTIAPVLGGGAAEAWVQRASEVTVRRLADEVGWALDVRDAGAACVSMAPPAHGGHSMHRRGTCVRPSMRR